MKSIKERAKEHSLEPRPNSSVGYDEEDLEESFEAGANYVLELIERIVNSAIENKSMTIPTWRLNYIIKQLKK